MGRGLLGKVESECQRVVRRSGHSRVTSSESSKFDPYRPCRHRSSYVDRLLFSCTRSTLFNRPNRMLSIDKHDGDDAPNPLPSPDQNLPRPPNSIPNLRLRHAIPRSRLGIDVYLGCVPKSSSSTVLGLKTCLDQFDVLSRWMIGMADDALRARTRCPLHCHSTPRLDVTAKQ